MLLFIWLVSGSPCSNDGTSWKDASEGEHIILPLALHGYQYPLTLIFISVVLGWADSYWRSTVQRLLR